MPRDAAHVADRSTLEIIREPQAPAHDPCESCGAETKAHHDGGRICSRRGCVAREAREHVKIKTPKAPKPAGPCRVCGATTKAHHDGGRICSRRGCAARKKRQRDR